MLRTTRMLHTITYVVCIIYMLSPCIYGEHYNHNDNNANPEHIAIDSDSNHYAYSYSDKTQHLTTYKKKKNVKKFTYCKKHTYYRVKSGDTLCKIARKFKISIHSLGKANNISTQYRVRQGQKIILPLCNKQGKNARRNKLSNNERKKRPLFQWPIKHIRNFQRDGAKGIRPIGLIIKARPNDFVHSSAHGIVKRIGRMRGFGKYVVIKHAGRYTTVYAHLKVVSVAEGDTLKRGQKIGMISATLHFQIDYAGKPLNPLKFLPRKS